MTLPSVRSLLRVLLALPDIGHRTTWLRAELVQMDPEDAARWLDALSERSARRDPSAREAMLVVAAVLLGLGESEWMVALEKMANRLRLPGLCRLLGPASWTAAAVEEVLVEELAVPDYGKGRELTLGERRSLARRPTRTAFDKLLSDLHPMVIHELLQNPHLTENDVVKLATRRPAHAAVLKELAGCPRWLCRTRVRMSLLLNPGAPLWVALPLLAVCSRTELREVISSTQVRQEVRDNAGAYLHMRRQEPGADEWEQ